MRIKALKARYTVGRLLLGFPFYQCDPGIRYLKEVGPVDRKTELIGRCRAVSGRLGVFHG